MHLLRKSFLSSGCQLPLTLSDLFPIVVFLISSGHPWSPALIPFLARFLISILRCAGNLPSSPSGTHRPLQGVVPSFRAFRRGVRGAFREGVRLFPSHRQGGRREVSRLRQSALRVRPDPLSGLPGGASSDVFLQDQGVLSVSSQIIRPWTESSITSSSCL